MPSIITHSIAGLAAGKIGYEKPQPVKFWILSAVCASIPDADTIGFKFGIRYSDFLGHRGFFHSLTFAFILSLFIVSLFFYKEKIFSKNWNVYLLYFFVVTSSHGILDAFTSGGLGIALLSPFDNTRYFFPWTPIEVAPIGIRPFFSSWGIRVILSEFTWIWMPLILIWTIVKRINLAFKEKHKRKMDINRTV